MQVARNALSAGLALLFFTAPTASGTVAAWADGNVIVDPIQTNLKSPGDNGSKPDRLVVTTDPARAGAAVKLFKVTKDGEILRPALAESIIGDKGRAHFKVEDRNGNKMTRYIAKVMKTGDTTASMSNVKGVR